MTDFARLTLVADASGMAPGEQALDKLARTGARVEDSIKLNTKGIEKAMASLGNVMGGLGGTMKSLEAAITKSMARTAQETQQSARSFEDLRRSIDPAYAASQRFADVQRELAAMVSAGAAEQAQANQVLEIARSRYLGVATAAEKAEEAQRQQAAAVAVATGNYQQLRTVLDPLYASSMRYEQALETANAALKAKIITEAEHARVLQMAESRYLALAPAATAATGGISKFTPVITNASYQVQDFAVQVASGQSAIMAFAQQFPQLAGAFGFTGTLALVGSALGTLVAVGIAVAPLLFDIGKGAKSASQAVDDLSEAVGNYKQHADDAARSNADLMAQFGSLSGEARRVSEALAQIAYLEAVEKMEAAVKNLTGTFGNLSKEMAAEAGPGRWMLDAGITITQFEKTVRNMSDTMKISEDQARRVAEALAQVGAAPVGEQAKAAADFNAEMIAVFGSLKAIPPQLREIVKETLRVGQETAVVAGNVQTVDELASALQSTFAAVGNSLGFAVSNTDSWAMAMAGVRAEILGIASALSQIGGGMISNAAKYVEINALKAGRSVAEARVEMEKFNVAAKYDGDIMAAEARGGILGWTEAQALKAAKAMEMSGIAAATEADALRKNAAEAERAAKSKGRSSKATSDAEKAAKKAARESERLAEKLDKEALKWRENLSPMDKYRQQMAELAQLTGRLSAGEMAAAQKKLNLELIDGIPLAGEFVDTLSEGLLNGFSGTLSSIMGMFKQWLAQMIATAAKNRIVVAMGMGGFGGIGAGDALTSALGAAGAPVGGMAGAGGVLGGLSGGVGALTGGFLSGASGFLGAAGGLGSAATYTSFMLKGATSGLAGLGSALGAIALPIAAVVGVFSFFKKKVKELDSGIRVTVDGMGTLVEEFRKTETKRFWGLSKKVRTSYDQADQETQDAISKVVGTLQTGVMDAAKVLGFGAETFAAFSHVMKVSTKGMSEEEALAAVQEAITGLGDDFAGMVPGLKALAKDGEGASDALLRLSQSLVGVNGIMDTLGHRFRAAGLSGADAASQLADAFGGLDAMASATQQFYQTFYSDAERLAVTTRQTREAVAKLGLTMPATRDEYRRMVAALDLTTEKGREAYAALISMSDAFDLILPQLGALSKELAALQGAVQTGLEGAISAASEAAKANADAASNWYKAAASIREYIDKLRGTASALFSPQQALRYNRNQYQATYTRAMAGDLTAAQDMSGVADRYLASVLDTAKTREEAALAQARVLSDLGLLQGVGDIEGARHDVIAGLLGQQVDLLKQTRDFLAGGGVLTDKMISELSGKLGGLDEAIAAAQLINYQYLKERLAVTVDVIADAKIPAHLKTLLGNAATGVTGFVDFIARADLPADLKWLALNGASEHVKTVEYLARNNLGAGLTRLALDTVGTLQKTVNLLVGKTLPVDVKRIALAGNSELSRTVNVVLGSKVDPVAKKLALGNVGAYAVNVMASLSPNIGAAARRLVISQQGTYAAMINAAISQNMAPAARRILLAQQGRYIANVAGILSPGLSGPMRALLLNANTAGARAITVAMAFAGAITPAHRALLLNAASTALRTIRGAINLSSLSVDGFRMLRASTGVIGRTIKGAVDLSGLTAQQRALLGAINGASAGKIILGGSFLFDPSKGFQTCYEQSSKIAISNPMNALKGAMGTLQGALGTLQAAIVAETKRAADAAARQAAHSQAVGRLTGVAAQVANDGSGGYLATAGQVQAMAKAAGISTANKTAQQLAQEVAAFSTGDNIDRVSVIDDLRSYLWGIFKQKGGQVAVDNGDYLRIYNDLSWEKRYRDRPAEHFDDWGRAEILNGSRAFNPQAFDWSSVGLSIPGFASGGSHLGGLRIVGENGPELEATGPSRIYSASQTRAMLDNRDLVAELKALRAEMAELRAHARRTADSVVQTEKTLKRVDAVGVKIDPDQNKVTA